MNAVNIAADWTITSTGAVPRAWVSVRDGAIAWIGPAGARDAPAGEVVDLGAGLRRAGLERRDHGRQIR